MIGVILKLGKIILKLFKPFLTAALLESLAEILGESTSTTTTASGDDGSSTTISDYSGYETGYDDQ